MAFDIHANFSSTTVTNAPTPAISGTSLTVLSASSFPATAPFNITIWPIGTQPSPANAEIASVTNVAGNVFSINRAAENSSARTILVGDNVALTVTKKLFTDIENKVVGLKSLWVPAKDWFPDSSTGCAALATRTAGGAQEYQHLAFDATTGEIAHATIVFPEGWDRSVITCIISWSGITAGAGGVAWRIGGVEIGPTETYAIAAGPQVQSVGTFLGVDVLQQTAISPIALRPSALSPLPGGGNLVRLQLFRNATDAADTRAADANVLGVLVDYTLV